LQIDFYIGLHAMNGGRNHLESVGPSEYSSLEFPSATYLQSEISS